MDHFLSVPRTPLMRGKLEVRDYSRLPHLQVSVSTFIRCWNSTAGEELVSDLRPQAERTTQVMH